MVVCCNVIIDKSNNYNILLAILFIIYKSMVISDVFIIILNTSMVIFVIFINYNLIDIINNLLVQQHLILYI